MAAGAAALVAAAGIVRADEGMWTFDNFPSAKVKQAYGVDITPAWLDKVRGASVRLSTGCSASVVSKDGLVLTNHHCVAGCAQDFSTPQQDYIQLGYAVASRRDERTCPGMQAEILTNISDVTERVTAATAGQTGQAFVKSRDAAMGAIEKEGCAGREATHRCQVISLYQGGQYKLYAYRKYSDVRLVFAPALETAFFGGDPDNFNFPRYDLDASFLRLYEGGAPVSFPGHLRWNADAPSDGEPVFVAGNPGSTSRLLTAEQLETLRGVVFPRLLTQFAELRGRLIAFGERGPEQQRIATHQLFGVENSFKAIFGEQEALNSPGFMGAKHRADDALKGAVATDANLRAATGDAWGEIARAQTDAAALYPAYSLLESRPGSGSDLYAYARRLVRGAQERAKPNAERLPEYADARLPLLEKTVLDAKPVDSAMEQLLLEFWLTKLRESLTADAPQTKLYLGRESPEALSRRLATSRLGDPALRKQLWDGGLAAVRASDDPLIVYVLATDEAARAVRKAYETRVSGPSDRAAARIAHARFAVYGTSQYPDATFSLRLSYGKITGWTQPGGEVVAPFTKISGLYDRATGAAPFALAPKWITARARLAGDTVLDVSTSNDVVGGNSGSPLINAKGEVIGAIFDGNIHSLGGDFAFDPVLNRSVAVSTAAITEALEKVYGQDELVRELTQR